MKHSYLIILLAGLLSCVDGHDSLEDPPVGLGSQEPFLLATDYGLVLSWMEPIDGDIHLRYSKFSPPVWSEPVTIAKGTNWFVNWADFPGLIGNGDKLFTHFLQMSGENTFDYDIMYTISNDRGQNWSEPRKLHSDTVKGEHGFVSGIPYQNGFAVAWLDGRNTKKEQPMMSLRGAIIDEQGLVAKEYELDSMTCDCCQTAMTAVDGDPLVLYRDRTAEEIRDISMISFNTTGTGAIRNLHNDQWEIKACPVNGPAVDSEDQVTAVAWYTGKDDVFEVRLMISTDGGRQFKGPFRVDGPGSFGRVDLKIFNGIIYVTYLTRNDDVGSIVLGKYDLNGSLVSKLPLATVSLERGTGFPRIAFWNNELQVVWTDINEAKVKLLSVPLVDDLPGIITQ